MYRPPALLLSLFSISLLACATAGSGSDDDNGNNASPDAGNSVAADAAPRADAPPTAADAAPPADAPPAAVDCTENTTISCGDLLEHSLFFADSTVANYSCQTVETANEDNIYRFVPTADASVTFTLDVLDDAPIIGDDFDLYVLEDVCGVANCAAESAAAGDETLTMNVTAGSTYFIVVEGFALGLLTLRDYDLGLTCN